MNARVWMFSRVGLLIACMWIPVPALCAPPPVETLEQWVMRWVDVRGQIAMDRREWERQKENWQREITLLEAEQARIQSSLDALLDGESAARARESALTREYQRLAESWAGVEAALDALPAKVEGWRMRIPPALMTDELSALFRLRPDAGTAPVGDDDAAMRLQAVLMGMAALESIQNQVHGVREIVTLDDGNRREMEVLYIGLTCAYAVSADGRIAMAGRPTDGGWQWSPANRLAPGIRRLLSVVRQASPPDRVVFPAAMAIERSATGSSMPGAKEEMP